MEWFDSRLQMQNLKDDNDLNIVTQEEMRDPWKPTVIFKNHKDRKRIKYDENASLAIRKEGNGTFNSQTDLDTAQVFEGSENPIVYKRPYSVDLECDFNLRSYPFDTQECFIELIVSHAIKRKVKLIAEEILYKGPYDLSQFVVKSSIVKNTKGVAYFIIILKRKFAYHLISVYIPSLSLLIISLATMHISVEHFEANIMVHLTAMLVMYTLFQAISISLPQVRCEDDCSSQNLCENTFKQAGAELGQAQP